MHVASLLRWRGVYRTTWLRLWSVARQADTEARVRRTLRSLYIFSNIAVCTTLCTCGAGLRAHVSTLLLACRRRACSRLYCTSPSGSGLARCDLLHANRLVHAYEPLRICLSKAVVPWQSQPHWPAIECLAHL